MIVVAHTALNEQATYQQYIDNARYLAWLEKHSMQWEGRRGPCEKSAVKTQHDLAIQSWMLPMLIEDAES
jgi:hypothetical protein